MRLPKLILVPAVSFSLIAAVLSTSLAFGQTKTADEKTVGTEHGMIGVGGEQDSSHTQHPDAQWYPDAGFGLFLHWGISSTKAMNISWPMIPGCALAAKKLDEAELARVIKEEDWNLNGKPNSITPNEYFAMAKDFKAENYDPDKWCKAAKETGFTYVVLTTRHHEGFALWPSKFGDFDTRNYMGGKDLLKPYVEACRKNGLKVGFYYSPPDWYFDREYMSFLYGGAYRQNPDLPKLDADLKPRTSKHSEEEIKKHQEEYAALVKGQVEELLTNYGKIDLLWFDGKPAIPNATEVITAERIHELQPGIVMNGRLHGKGDFLTYERTLKTDKVANGWAEYCNTWTTAWPYVKQPFRSDGWAIGQLVKCRSLGVNYLLGIGPTFAGELPEDAYKNMAVVADWMKANGASIRGTKPLAETETASVPATASASTRYLFAIPQFKGNGMYDQDMEPATDTTVSIKGVSGTPASVKLLGDGTSLNFEVVDGALTVQLPAAKRTKLVDVIQIDFSPVARAIER